MPIEPFALERWQSRYEHTVGINLSESGVHPLRVRDLLEPDDLDSLLEQSLEYTQTNGTIALRERIATLYQGATPADILVTNGGSEANFVTCWKLISPGDEVVSIQPNYMQIPGLARAFGATIREVAGHLGLSTHTVRTHVRNIYRVLGVGNRLELARSLSFLRA